MIGRERLAPTRINLLRARRELARVTRGAALTRRKREALVAELFRFARPAVDARQRLAAAATRAAESLADALAVHGSTGFAAMAWPLTEPLVELRPAQVWGIPVSDVVNRPPLAKTLDARGLAPSMVGPAATETAARFEELAELLIDAAPSEQRVRRLGEALAMTTRRLRTLEQRVAPALLSQIGIVRRQLEEREREEQLRLKHVERRRHAVTIALLLLPFAAPARAQLTIEPRRRDLWIGSAVALGAGFALDVRLRDLARDNQRPTLDHLAGTVDPFGRAGYLVPALAGAWLIPRLAGRRSLTDAVLRIGLGYAAADGIEAVIKPLVGRHRPADGGGAWRFRSLSRDDEWYSFPSAHTVHAFSLAAGIADEYDRPWATALSYGVATLVGAQRIYRRAHWASDVVASATLGIAASRTTTRWLRRRGLGRLLLPAAANLRLAVAPRAIALTATF